MNLISLILLIIVHLVSLGQTQNASTALDASVPIALFKEIMVRDTTIEVFDKSSQRFVTVPNDIFKSAIFSRNGEIICWTDGPSSTKLFVFPFMSDFSTGQSVNSCLMTEGMAPFADASEIMVQTGAYDDATGVLYMVGSSTVYRVPSIKDSASLGSATNSFKFPFLLLPRVSFLLSNTLYVVQSFNDFPNIPKLFAINVTAYTDGYNSNITSYILTTSETSSYLVIDSQDILFLAARGRLEARALSDLSTVKFGFTFANISAEGSPLNIKAITADNERNFAYFCGDIDGGTWVVRVNYASNFSSLNDQNINLKQLPDGGPITAFQIPVTGMSCTGIVIDPSYGVGFVALTDLSFLGYLNKFDIRYMYTLSSPPTVPIERDQTQIIAMYIDTVNKVLYTVLPYSIASYVKYPTSCPNDCTSPENGVCIYSRCNCTINWIGADCNEAACISGCNEPNGYCSNGKCICNSYWNGTTCSERRCPDDCSGTGTCIGQSNNWTCICDDLRDGENCGKTKYTTCESISASPNAKSLCLKFGKTCGWCNDDSTCKTGNRIGPEVGACRFWLYDGDLEAWPVAVASIIIICWAAMFIINSVSAILEDFKIAHNLETTEKEGDSKSQRRAWWRDERSAKSWKLWDQIQFLSLYTITNMYFSTRFYNFTSLFNWTNFCIPLPSMADTNTYTSRRITSIDQYANSIGVQASDVFWVCLIWWLITLGVALVLYGIFYIVVTKVLKKGESYSQVLLHRFFHLASRLFLAGYLPVCCLAAWGIVSNVNGKMVVPIIFFLLFAFGLPVFNFLVVKGEKTDFLYYQTRIRYGALYVQFKQDKAIFAFVVYVRKLALAICFGFLATTSISDTSASLTLFWVQIIIPAIFMLIYIVLLFIIKPYVDVVHAFLDGFLNLLNILTLAVSILFRSDKPSDRDSGLMAVMILQITGLICVIFAYLYTWVFYAGYKSVMDICRGKKPDDDPVEVTKKPLTDKEKASDNKSSSTSEGDPKKKTEEKKKSEDKKTEETKKKPKKKDEVKEVDEENLGNLEISE